MSAVGVFCSARDLNPAFDQAARDVAAGLVARQKTLVYGGSNVGLMAVLANEVLRLKGRVVGVIPHCLVSGAREVAHSGLTELELVNDLLDRKKRMMDLSDAFIILPGGLGTLDEALDAITYKTLGLHTKPIVFLDIRGFWQPQLKVFDEMVRQGAVSNEALNVFSVCTSVEQMWCTLDAAKPVA